MAPLPLSQNVKWLVWKEGFSIEGISHPLSSPRRGQEAAGWVCQESFFVSTTLALVPGTCKAQQWILACSPPRPENQDRRPPLPATRSLWMKSLIDRNCTYPTESRREGQAGVWIPGCAGGESPAHSQVPGSTLPSSSPQSLGCPSPAAARGMFTFTTRAPESQGPSAGRMWGARSILISRLEGFSERRDLNEGLEEYMRPLERAWGSEGHQPDPRADQQTGAFGAIFSFAKSQPGGSLRISRPVVW